MAYFRKRGDKWSAEIRKNGKSISKRFANKKLAQQWALMMEAGDNIEKTSKITLGEALERYGREYSHKKKAAKNEINRIRRIRTWDIAYKRLDDITLQDLNALRDDMLTKVAPATVNRELGLIMLTYKTARVQWEITNNNPCANFKFPKEPPPRFRRISDSEHDRILSALFYDENKPVSHVRDEVAIAYMLAIETGMRQGEIWGLTWDNIHLEDRYLTLYDTKNSDNRDVPLSTRAIELLSKLQKRDNYRDNNNVFKSRQDHGAIVFRRALKIAQIDDLRFHDTRHEAITRLARKLDVLDLARMIGHRDPRSLMIYYNPTAKEIADRLG